MTPGTEKRRVDFTDVVFYLAIASKHARLMVLLVSVALAAGLVYYVYARPLYNVRADVEYFGHTATLGGQEEAERERFYDSQVLNDLQAPHVTKIVLNELGYREDPDGGGKPMVKKIGASFDSEQNILLDIYVFEPSWCRQFPELLVEAYMKDRAEKRKVLRERIEARYDAEITRLEEKISEFQKEKRAFDGNYRPDDLRMELDQLRKIPRDLVLVREKIATYERVKKRLLTSKNLTTTEKLTLLNSVDVGLKAGMLVPATPEDGMMIEQTIPGQSSVGGSGGGDIVRRDDVRGTPVHSGRIARMGEGGSRATTGQSRVVQRSYLNNPAQTWEDLVRDQYRLEQEIQDNSRVFLPRHPKMIALQRELTTVRQRLDTARYNAATRFELAGSHLYAQEKDLLERMPRYEKVKNQWDEYESKRPGLSSTPWQSAYEKARQELERALFRLDQESVTLQFRSLKRVRDQVPISPSRAKLVVFSLLLGLGLAIGIPFLLEFLDQTVTNMDKLEAETHMKGLGLVPDFEETIAEAYPLLGSDTMTDPDMLENFRVIRTNLIASAATSKYPQIIMVTSTGPKEGKTVVSANLALSFAQMGDKTLLIDTNLRRGLVHHLFSVRSSPGLSNVLCEKLDVSQAIRETSTENLSVLATGDHLDGDIEMFGSTRMQQVMEELRGKYQRIVLDSPPVLGLSETAILQPVVDGTVMVIWSAFTSTRQIRTAMDILKDNHANFYGFVLNRLDLSATMNRFHYYYYSNHYYNRYQSLTRVS